MGPGVVSTDASEEGFGATLSFWGPEAAAGAGRAPERSRFKKLPGAAARGIFGMLPESELVNVAESFSEEAQRFEVDCRFPKAPPQCPAWIQVGSPAGWPLEVPR